MKTAAFNPEVQHCRQITDLLTPNSNLNLPFVKLPLALRASPSSVGTPNIVNLDELCYNEDECEVSFDNCLWSSGQSFWLQIQRSRVRFPALPDFSE